MWTQNLTLLEDQGLWIQALVLHCSCAKAASSLHFITYGSTPQADTQVILSPIVFPILLTSAPRLSITT